MKPGNVPTERYGQILGMLIRDRWPHGGGIEVLADKVGCDWTAIESIVVREHKGVSFDLADRLLCALGRSDIWTGELSDIYPTTFVETCALHSCHKTFPEKKVGALKRYCSPRCRKAATDIKRHRGTGERHRQRNRCLKGHALTPESTAIFGDGRRACKKCRRINQAIRYRERYQSDPAFAEKQRARARDYDQRKRNGMRDIRDPQVVGQSLLDLCETQKQIQPSVLADLSGLPAPDWTGDGLMSNDPALHHSMTSQVGNERIEAVA